MSLNGTLAPIDRFGLETICLLHADVIELERDKRRYIRLMAQKAKAEGRKLEGSARNEFERSVEGARLDRTIRATRAELSRERERHGLSPAARVRLQGGDAAASTPTRGVQAEVNEIESLIQ